MGEAENDNLNFIKLEGKRVEDGKITLTDVHNILSGIEKTTKYFINSEHPELKDNYDIEIRLESGSLIAWLVSVVIGGGLAAYAISAGTQMAKNDVGDKTSKEILDKAVKKIKSTARIAKHMGVMGKHQFHPEETKITGADNIVIINPSGEELTVTKDELETYAKAPKDIFKKITSVVDNDTQLFIGEAGETTQSDTIVRIDADSKPYFGSNNADDDGVVFPEWQHGENLKLKGTLSRANTNTGTLGFVYGGHILTSTLKSKEIRDIKDSLFDKEIEIEATIIRTQKKLDADDELKKPKLEITKLTTIGDITPRDHTVQLFNPELVTE